MVMVDRYFNGYRLSMFGEGMSGEKRRKGGKIGSRKLEYRGVARLNECGKTRLANEGEACSLGETRRRFLARSRATLWSYFTSIKWVCVSRRLLCGLARSLLYAVMEKILSLLVSSFDTFGTRYREFPQFLRPVLPIKRKLNDSMANLPIEKE